MKNLKKLIIISVLVISCALTACSKPSVPAAPGAEGTTESEPFISSEPDLSDTQSNLSDTESNFFDAEQTTSKETTPVNLPPETIEEEQTYSDPWTSFDEMIRLDQELLKTLEEDKPCVMVYLHFDIEAARNEYKETYPKIKNDPIYLCRFLSKRANKLVCEVASDYGIIFVEPKIWVMMVSFWCKPNKDTISLLLNDPRVIAIYYSVGEYPAGYDF